VDRRARSLPKWRDVKRSALYHLAARAFLLGRLRLARWILSKAVRMTREDASREHERGENG